MSNSPLVDYTRISPNKNSPRNHKIDTITIHCVVGQCTVETLGNIFAPTSRQASSNYGVGTDGKIGMYVEEKDRSWCSSNAANDNRAVTIEVASDTKHPYAVNDRAFAALLDLVTDICKRNGIKKLVWSTKKADRVNHKNGCNMTVHRDYANKSCPGDYLYNRHGEIAAEVNRRLGVADTAPDAGAAQGVTVYTVKKGDTLSQIAAKYGTTYQAIAAYNGIKNPNVIRVGQKIKIPASTAPAALKKGDRVKVLNAVTYDGKPFRTYYDTYDVIQVSGTRVVIGVGATVTAAVNAANLRKV
jgi:LysM repeat protein